jgi:hypothetical protein
MTILYLFPAITGLILLGLHFFRNDNAFAMYVSFLVIFLMFVRRPWVARILQTCLIIGAFEWVRTTVLLTIERNQNGEPFLRLAIILGAVALFTLFSALIFRTKRIRSHFNDLGGA